MFRAVCPYGAGNFTAQNGTITIPSNYATSVTCEYRITTGAPIYLRFDSFATEGCCDFVFVYDGTSSSGSLKGKLSGMTTPAIQTATSGSMFIRFTSDSNKEAAGVSMTWLDAMPNTLAPTSAPTLDGLPPTAAANVSFSAKLWSHDYTYRCTCTPSCVRTQRCVQIGMSMRLLPTRRCI